MQFAQHLPIFTQPQDHHSTIFINTLNMQVRAWKKIAFLCLAYLLNNVLCCPSYLVAANNRIFLLLKD